MKRKFGILAVGISLSASLTAGLIVVGAAPAAAHTPYVVRYTDYCTKVPDAVAGLFDFRHPCVHHDYGYKTHWTSKYWVDTYFLWNMESHCRNRHAWWSDGRRTCLNWARMYHLGVKYLGLPAWNHRSMWAPMNYVR